MLRPFGPSIDHLGFRVGICGQTAKPPGCESLTVNCEQCSVKKKKTCCIGMYMCVYNVMAWRTVYSKPSFSIHIHVYDFI